MCIATTLERTNPTAWLEVYLQGLGRAWQCLAQVAQRSSNGGSKDACGAGLRTYRSQSWSAGKLVVSWLDGDRDGVLRCWMTIALGGGGGGLCMSS